MNRRGYNNLARQYADNLYKFVLFHLRDEATSQDIVQEAFLKLWERRKEVDEDKAVKWLFVTARNLYLNYIRHKNVIQNYKDRVEMTAYVENSRFENKDMIAHCLEDMSEVQKTVMLLRDLEGYDYKSIGEIAGISESQVKVYLYRARKKFREEYQKLQNESK